MSSLKRFLPDWLIDYPRHHLAADLTAGLIVCILVIPQSLAYALLAGLPPQAGLYVSIFPVMFYALLGSSRVQALGPVAITSIMTFAVLSPLAIPGSTAYLVLAATLALLSGIFLLSCGLLRLGFLSQLLSRPVISGFISGAAILIIFSQLKYLFGLHPASNDIAAIMQALRTQWQETSIPTATIGIAALLILSASRTLLPTLLTRLGLAGSTAAFIGRLMPLLVVLLATAVVIGLKLDLQHGVAVIGPIAEGLPDFVFFLPSADILQQLLLPALLMTLIGMVQGISIAQALAIKRQERIDANAELRGLGAANIMAAFYGGMPVGAGLSRSAVNVAAGAQTPLASVVAALFMMAIISGAAEWFVRLPLAVLAASIIIAAASMVDLNSLRQAWYYDRADALAWLGTAGGVMLLGLEKGIALGILLSLATLLFRASTPHIAVIGRIPQSEHFRNVERHEVETIPGVLLLRIDENLFFGNLTAVENRLDQELQRQPDLSDIVLIMSAVNRVDTTAMAVLTDLNRELAERHIRLHLAEVKGPVQDRLAHSPLWPALSGQVFLAVNDAYEAFSNTPRLPEGRRLLEH